MKWEELIEWVRNNIPKAHIHDATTNAYIEFRGLFFRKSGIVCCGEIDIAILSLDKIKQMLMIIAGIEEKNAA